MLLRKRAATLEGRVSGPGSDFAIVWLWKQVVTPRRDKKESQCSASLKRTVNTASVQAKLEGAPCRWLTRCRHVLLENKINFTLKWKKEGVKKGKTCASCSIMEQWTVMKAVLLILELQGLSRFHYALSNSQEMELSLQTQAWKHKHDSGGWAVKMGPTNTTPQHSLPMANDFIGGGTSS